MKKVFGLAVALGLCFICAGCEVDDLKKEVANKNSALSNCEAGKTALSKQVQKLSAAVTAKEGETKAAQEALAAAQSDLSAAKGAVDASRAEIETVRSELAGVQAQLKECADAAAAAAAKKSKKK